MLVRVATFRQYSFQSLGGKRGGAVPAFVRRPPDTSWDGSLIPRPGAQGRACAGGLAATIRAPPPCRVLLSFPARAFRGHSLGWRAGPPQAL